MRMSNKLKILTSVSHMQYIVALHPTFFLKKKSITFYPILAMCCKDYQER